jgi:hypothetical protein
VNAGSNWLPTSTGLANLHVEALVINPNDPAVIYAGTNGGVFKSADAGGSWQSSTQGLRSMVVFGLAFDVTNADTLYAGTYGDGVFRSVDKGAHWEQMTTAGLADRFIWELISLPPSPTLIHAGTNAGVFTLRTLAQDVYLPTTLRQ